MARAKQLFPAAPRGAHVRPSPLSSASFSVCVSPVAAGLLPLGLSLSLVAVAGTRSLGLSDAEFKKVVIRLPSVLGYSVEANVLPSLAALQSRLGLSDAELIKVVLRTPPVLGLSVEVNVLPKLDFLQRELGLSDETLREHVVCVERIPLLRRNSLGRKVTAENIVSYYHWEGRTHRVVQSAFQDSCHGIREVIDSFSFCFRANIFIRFRDF